MTAFNKLISISIAGLSFCLSSGARADMRKLDKAEIESSILNNTYEVLQDNHATGVYYIWLKNNQMITGGYKTYSPKNWRFVGNKICYDYDEGTSCITFYMIDERSLGMKWNEEKTPKLWRLYPEAVGGGRLSFLQVLNKTISTVNNSQDSREDKLVASNVKTTVAKELAVEQGKAQAEQARIASDPAVILRSMYRAYAYAKSCFDARKSYASVYVSDTELGEARSQMKSLDVYYKAKAPSLNIDELWNDATRDVGDVRNSVLGFEATRDMCQYNLREIRGANAKIGGINTRAVKDF